HHCNHRICRFSTSIPGNCLQIERFVKTRSAVANAPEKPRFHSSGNRRLNKSLQSLSVRISRIRRRPNDFQTGKRFRRPNRKNQTKDAEIFHHPNHSFFLISSEV